MAIDGNYEIEIDTPMGTQTIKLNFKTKGAVLNGSSESPFGKSRFTGKVNGDEVSWDAEITSPMGKMQLSFKGKIVGDTFNGDVNTGVFGTFPFHGKRV
jgi:hypothetical protein